MIKIGVIGAAGRMGRKIIQAIIQNKATELGGAIDIASFAGKDAGELAGAGPLGIAITTAIESAAGNCDVFIDFSGREATLQHIKDLEKLGKRVVIGTTGLTDDEIVVIEKAAEKIPVLFAPNMSLGVNLLFEVIKDVTRAIGDSYDIEIVEAHHNQKKDAPSGTAKKFAEIICETLGRELADTGVYGRQGMTGKRTAKEIGIHAVRAGDIVGEHTITFAGPGERIEIVHKAHSRQVFANGSVTAAVWLVQNNKAPGLYAMKDTWAD